MSFASISCPMLGIAGFSGSGKTTLLKAVLPLLTEQGLNLALIKHTHHDVEQDSPGKDSYELRHAGAAQTLLAGPRRSILTQEYPAGNEPSLQQSLAQLHKPGLDLILVEGFRDEPFTKLEIHRPAHGKPLLCRHDPHILAVATDSSAVSAPVPLLALNQPRHIADVILQWLAEDRLTRVAC